MRFRGSLIAKLNFAIVPWVRAGLSHAVASDKHFRVGINRKPVKKRP
jgi:hypothetical protein